MAVKKTNRFWACPRCGRSFQESTTYVVETAGRAGASARMSNGLMEKKRLHMQLGCANDREKRCFLSSACARSRGLPDDCLELELLRAFRDDHLLARAEGAALVEEYYAIAPAIVAAIDARSDSASKWDEVYQGLVRPCVDLIRDGRHEAAAARYQEFVLGLRSWLQPC